MAGTGIFEGCIMNFPNDLFIMSGGQTGVDRGALDAALEFGAPCGGWCPKGRRAEDGVIPLHYPLRETVSSGYDERTKWNVIKSDGTLVIFSGRLTIGTALTITICNFYKKPIFMVDVSGVDLGAVADDIVGFIKVNNIEKLNVAGTRHSKSPGIYSDAKLLVLDVLKKLK
jgi:hypothetical protein